MMVDTQTPPGADTSARQGRYRAINEQIRHNFQALQGTPERLLELGQLLREVEQDAR